MTEDQDRSFPVTPVNRLSAPLAAIEQLRALIQDGTLAPGDRLPPERQLAEMLGVSRPTLREALSALSLLNIVETRHGAGRVVGSLDVDTLSAPLNVLLSLALPSDRNVESVVEMRAVIESGLARLAAMRISDEALAEYRAGLDRLHEARTPQEVLQRDMVLHDIIARESGNSLLASLLRAFRELTALARSQTIRVRGVQASVADDQERIYEALARRDPEAAAEAMWAHLWRIEQAFRNRRAADERADDDKENDDDAVRT